MSENKNGSLRPDGFSASIPVGPISLGGTYYWNPGSPTAPTMTLTGGLGVGGGGLHTVFLRKGMTSQDSLGYGASADIAPTVFPSVVVNGSIPDESGTPKPWNAKVSSVESGIGLPGFAATYTTTPQQIADFLSKSIFSPAMGPEDELSPFVRSLRSGVGTIGTSNSAPIPFTGPHAQKPLGGGMSRWGVGAIDNGVASADSRTNGGNANPSGLQNGGQPPASAFTTGAAPIPYSPSPQAKMGGIPGLIAQATGSDPTVSSSAQPGGLLGLILENMRNNAGAKH